MKYFILFFIPSFCFADNIPPTAFPIFLKSGFSTVLEFENPPSQVVLGDAQSFQIEKLSRSIAIKPLTTEAITNMFVYFKSEPSRLFILTASDDANPTYFKSFKKQTLPNQNLKPQSTSKIPIYKKIKLTGAQFDQKKDYLTIDLLIAANSHSEIIPLWDKVHISYKKKSIKPTKLWSERKIIQRDTGVKARFIFSKPDIPRNLSEVTLLIPEQNLGRSFSIPLRLVKP